MNIEIRTSVTRTEFKTLKNMMNDLKLEYCIYDVKGDMIKEVWIK